MRELWGTDQTPRKSLPGIQVVPPSIPNKAKISSIIAQCIKYVKPNDGCLVVLCDCQDLHTITEMVERPVSATKMLYIHHESGVFGNIEPPTDNRFGKYHEVSSLAL